MTRFLLLILAVLAAGCVIQLPGGDVEDDTAADEVATMTDTDTDADTDQDDDGWSVKDGDCNDTDSAINPGATDAECDGIDQNCDGIDGEPAPPSSGASECGGVDNDGDGYLDVDGNGEPVDCDDTDASVNPGATEVCGDGVDQDCDGFDAACDEPDTDGDGSADDVDCGPDDATVYPGAVEVADDGIDQDCDGADLVDVDCDGYAVPVDCDDTDASINPDATEVCDELDNDCDGESDEVDGNPDVLVLWDDDDGDGYGDDLAGSFTACPADGFVEQGGDCDDSDAWTFPGAVEECDGEDQDCDGTVDNGAIGDPTFTDADKDGYGYGGVPNLDCTPPEGNVDNNTDCDDTDASINPSANESDAGIDGLDNDCDGSIDEDWQAYVEAEYSSTNYYVLNAGFYISGATPNSLGWQESDTETSGTTTSVEFLTSEYGDMSGACGVIVNVSVGNPASSWLCESWAIDETVALDVWIDGVWYDEEDVAVWIAEATTGECAVILQVDPSTLCTPVDDQ